MSYEVIILQIYNHVAPKIVCILQIKTFHYPPSGEMPCEWRFTGEQIVVQDLCWLNTCFWKVNRDTPV